ncbi:hypothetical protein PISL3812_09050 [Talaromyces islandicus]|uniref:Uncharacterized protein n=1 Tax=Talaromyces islandicus TaxID=28573 RepID=A0A0U1MAP6_TALIS|nr:hypothetical protein PISL3812_09050 [Talaromyces islandicus]
MYASLEGRKRQRTPWPTLILIVLMMACKTALAVIIVVSDGQAVSSWRVSPAVLLALLSSLWSSSLALVLTMSTTITWWRSASEGATLETLHCIWKRGLSIWHLSALRSSAVVRRVVLVAWIVIISQVTNNSLLQRATQTALSQRYFVDNMTLDVQTQIPDGWMGYVFNSDSMVGSRNSLGAIQDWWMNKTISTSPQSVGGDQSNTQCNGTCHGSVKGMGISYECSSTSRSLDLLEGQNGGTFIFSINTTLSYDSESDTPFVDLLVVYSSAVDGECIATLNMRSCRIEAAIVEYPIVIQNTTVALERGRLDPPVVVEPYVSKGDMPTATAGQGAGPLQGINGFIYDTLTTNVSLVIRDNKARHTGRFIGDIFFEADESAYNQTILHTCGLQWSDPTLYVLDAMQDFLFRSSVTSARNSTDDDEGVRQMFSVNRTSDILTFQSNYRFLAAALGLMSLALGCVILQLWGWWKLRHCVVSLSPVEVANSFGALATTTQFNNHDSSPRFTGDTKDVSTVDDILRAVGKTTVKYDGVAFRGRSVYSLQGRPISLGVLSPQRRDGQ